MRGYPQKSIKETVKKSQITAQELASVVGSIISISVVFGRVARVMTRHCQISIAAVDAWDTQQNVDDYCRLELWFWDSKLKKFNKKNCFTYPVHRGSRSDICFKYAKFYYIFTYFLAFFSLE